MNCCCWMFCGAQANGSAKHIVLRAAASRFRDDICDYFVMMGLGWWHSSSSSLQRATARGNKKAKITVRSLVDTPRSFSLCLGN